MRRFHPTRSAIVFALLCSAASGAEPVSKPAAAAAAIPAEHLEFFEAKIRPVLVEKCYSCHSAQSKALRGGLLLDSRDGLLKGGDSGPSLVPGKPDESLLIEALRFESFEMPPSGKLSQAVIDDFIRWVELGAPDPRTAPTSVAKKGIDLEAGRKFWAFQPIADPTAPQVKDTAWAKSDIDRFVLAPLEAKQLKPAADADAVALCRRIYFDLIGLPPTPAEVEDFVRSTKSQSSDDAVAALVDKLLASPHFGERWGRHWLDVARFAESSGGGRSVVFKDAWRYRDYVIDSFNSDKPFDRFIVEQLAGDLLKHETEKSEHDQLVATAYLVLGAHNYEEQDKRILEMDVADEQIDTIGRGLLGMTLACARCHDHKFDPIPTADYYAIAGILRSTNTLIHDNVSTWTKRPLPMNPEQAAAIEKHDAEVAELKQQLAALKKTAVVASRSGKGPITPIAVAELPGIVIDDAQATRVGNWSTSKHVKSYIGDGYLVDDNEGKGEKTLTFQPEFKKGGMYEVRLAYTASSNRASEVPVSILHADGEFSGKIDQREIPPIDGRFISLGRFRFDETNQWFVMLSNEGTLSYVTCDAVQFLPVDEAEVATPPAPAKAADKSTPASEKDAAAKKVADEKAQAEKDAIAALEKKLKKLETEGPQRPTAMAVEEAEKIEDCKICIRGNVHNRGPAVPRGVLKVATIGAAPVIPDDESGRRQLAEWIASDRNPLTARVYANRVWQYLFGVGLVRSVDNFGITGELPSHPELLDHLAQRFIAGGWSTKQLIREIVLSRTYRQSTAMNKKAAAVDPENRLLWRMNRRRLDAESLRDAMLLAAGKLELGVGGPNINDPTVVKGSGTINPTEYTYVFQDFRRSVYTPAFRNRLHELFEVFDFADQNGVSGRRNNSTVAPQALFLLNSPFVIETARAAAAHSLKERPELSDAERIEDAFRRTLGRRPTEQEAYLSLSAIAPKAVDLAAEQTGAADEARLAAWERVYQALFGCLDFRYLE